MNKKLFNVFWFAIGPLGAAFINFITVPILTWFITPEELGRTSMFMIFQTLAVSIMYLGMDHAFVREFNDSLSKQKLLNQTILVPIILAFLVMLFVLIIGISNLLISDNKENSIILLIFAIWLPFVVAERFLLLKIRMDGNGKLFSVYTLLIRLSILICTVLLLFAEKSYIMVIIAMVMGQVMVDAIIIIENRSCFKEFKWIPELNELKEMLKFGFPIMIGAIVIWLLNSTDRLLIEHLTDYEQLGIYFAATKITAVVLTFNTVFQTIWIPIAYRWYNNNISEENFHNINKLLCFILSLLFCVVLIFKDYIVSILSSEYTETIHLIPFLLLAPIMYSLSEATGIGISFVKKTKYNLVVALITIIFNILLNWMLIKEYGAVGASVGTGISYVLYFWLKTLISRKLWYNFSLNYFFLITIILIVCSSVNLIVSNSTIINVIFLFIILCLSINQLKNIRTLKFFLKN